MPPSSHLRSRRDAIKARIQSTRPQLVKGHRFRLMLVWLVLALGHGGLFVRLYYLQVKATPDLQTRAEEQQLTQLAPRLSRHPIVDREGHLLAKDEPMFWLFAHPIQFSQSAAQVAKVLAPILKKSATALEQQFAQGDTGISIARDLSEEVATQIRDLQLDGLELNQEWQRIYPQEDLAAGVVGYVNTENRGQAGLEYSQQPLLTAKSADGLVSKDGQGWLLPDRFPLQPFNAEDFTLRLTLDLRIQRAARVALQQQLRKFSARRGTVIVMDVADGALVALSSEPSYDPQRYYEADTSLFKNWAVADLYEPGSTFKPINVAIALESKAVSATSRFYDEGQIMVGGWPINNSDGSGHGSVSVTEILEFSSNVGMVHIMEQMKRAEFYQSLQKLGVGQITGTDLPFETPGQLKSKQQFIDYPIEAATTAFGQGFSVTPLQMAQLHGAIANGGKLVTPHVIQGLYDATGRPVKSLELIPPRRVFSTETANHVTQMMGSVVANGTGKPAQIPGYRLGGKTGTAQKAIGGGYSNQRITSFVATFPLEQPKYVILVVVDEPQGGNAYGSTVAAPVAKSVIETVIAVEGIPPSHPEELKK